MSHNPERDERAPKQLYAQVLRDGSMAAYEHDPREVHDNGKPVYVYQLSDNDAGTPTRRGAQRGPHCRVRSTRPTDS